MSKWLLKLLNVFGKSDVLSKKSKMEFGIKFIREVINSFLDMVDGDCDDFVSSVKCLKCLLYIVELVDDDDVIFLD